MGRAVAWFTVVTLLLVMTVWSAIMTTMYVFAKKPPASVESASTEAEIQRLQDQLKQKQEPVVEQKTAEPGQSKVKEPKALPNTDKCKLYVVEPQSVQPPDERFSETLVFDKDPGEPAVIKAFVHAMENLKDAEWAYFAFGPVPEDQDLVAMLANGLRLSDLVSATALQPTENPRTAFVLNDKVYTETQQCDNFALTKETLDTLAATLLERFVSATDAVKAISEVLKTENNVSCVSASSLA